MSAQLLADNIRKAAHGKHVCQVCRERIGAGERYRDVRMADSGTAWTWREHIACRHFMHKHMDPFDYDQGYDHEWYVEVKAEHDAGHCCQESALPHAPDDAPCDPIGP